MTKILFFSQNTSPFRETDKEILNKSHNVTSFYLDSLSIGEISNLLEEIRECDIIYCWFASELSLIITIVARAMGKKTILVAGGYDVARVPEINYGLTLDIKREVLSRVGLRCADIVLCVSKNTKKEVLKISPNATVETIYVGSIDTELFRPAGSPNKNTVLTVGAISESNLQRKGLKFFAKASNFNDDKKFIILGKKENKSAVNKLKSIGGDNLLMTGYVEQQNLIKYMQEAKTYLQPSLHEGFGISVAEAMACECVPVVSHTAALPEVVGNTGLYLDNREPNEINKKIERAKNISGHSARQRIIEKFSRSRRQSKLLELISSFD